MRRPKTYSVEEKINNMIFTSGWKSVLLCDIKQSVEEKTNLKSNKTVICHRVSLHYNIGRGYIKNIIQNGLQAGIINRTNHHDVFHVVF